MSSVCISAKSKAFNTMTFALVVLLANVTLVASYAFYNSNPDAMVRSIRTELSSISEPLLYDLSHETNSHGKQPPIRTLHHISLPPKDDSYSSSAEALVRECWKWKDSVLGDGRDYFVPRPKTLMAFHSLFVGMEICVYTDIVHDAIADSELELVLNRVSLQPQSTNNKTAPSLEIPMLQKDLSVAKQSDSSRCITKRFVIEECVALSNCARFEILLVLKEQQQQHRTNDTIEENISLVRETAARISVAYHLWRQTRSHKSRSDSLFQRSGLTSWLDLPDSIDLSIFNPISIDQSIDIVQLAQKFTSIEGARSISNHISLIAGGLAPRTNRPDRDVIFRPYSSRDAHILLQLKRTAEVVSTLNVVEIQGGRGRIKILLDCALSAGKAARNERIVPDIRQLKQFGSDGTPPIGLANAVAKAAIALAVNPAVNRCVSRLKALEAANQISLLRQRINGIVDSIILHPNPNNSERNDLSDISQLELQKVANELLHDPMIRLREGKISDTEIETLVQNIESQLQNYAKLHLEKEAA